MSLLASSKIAAFSATANPERAKTFYRDQLGLKLVSDETYALVFDANGTMLRVTTVRELVPDPFTVLGWDVESIETTVDKLTATGVEILRFPGMNDTEPRGIWTAPSGAKIAWFKDPDGNALSVTEF